MHYKDDDVVAWWHGTREWHDIRPVKLKKMIGWREQWGDLWKGEKIEEKVCLAGGEGREEWKLWGQGSFLIELTLWGEMDFFSIWERK